MNIGKITIPFVLTFIGSILLVANGALILKYNSPIIVSSYSASDVQDVLTSQTFYGRVAFGIPGQVEGTWGVFWLSIGIITLICSISLFVKQTRSHYSNIGTLISILSAISIFAGGGFILGSILAFLGGLLAKEWPKEFKSTFIGKLIRALKLDPKFYRTIAEDTTGLKTAAFVIIIVNLLSGLGNSFYICNYNIIKKANPTEIDIQRIEAILLKGQLFGFQAADLTILTAISFIGVALIKWYILSLLLYTIGGRLATNSSTLEKTARTIAFAYVPISLQMFMPVMFSNEPTLTNWPLAIVFFTNFWLFIAMVTAVKTLLEIPTTKALGIVIFAGTIYWLINNLFIIPNLKTPGIGFELSYKEPLPVLTLVSIACVLATLLGAFSRE